MSPLLDAEVRTAAGPLAVAIGCAAEPGEVIAVVGPNGAGKTTLLRSLAGLHPPTGGRVVIDGRDVTHEPPAGRQVGYVPQDGALFPHLDARHNVAFGLRARGTARRAALAEADRWLDRLGVGELADRQAGRLSGGQAGRVALARALAPGPRLLLLDEPLAALDADTRADVRRTLRRHLADFDGVCLVVTHDPVDALTLAGRLLVVEDGRATHDGAVADVVARPRSPWVAGLLGHNAYPGTATDTGLVTETGFVLVAAEPLVAGTPAIAVVHPQAVALHRHRPEGSPRNTWSGTVGDVTALGGRVRVHVEGVEPVTAELTPAGAAALRLSDGGPIWASVKATEVQLSPV